MAILRKWLCARASTVVFLTILISACSALGDQNTARSSFAETETNLQSSDLSLAKENLQVALEKTMSGDAVRWRNPDSGASGSVTPLKTWKTSAGKYCRSYLVSIRLASGKSVDRQGVACRTSNAVWRSA